MGILKNVDVDFLKNLYSSGMSLERAGRSVGVSLETARQRLKAAGVVIRPSGIRKLSLNECFFEQPLSRKAAYWLGFILADGNVHNNTLRVVLSEKDIDHLKKLLCDLDSGTHIYHRKDRNQVGITIKNKALTLDLEKLNIVPRKSLIAVPPELDSGIETDFWRGVVDGDGCIYLDRGKPAIVLVGSEGTCCGFSGWLKSIFGYEKNAHKSGSIYRISINKKSVVVDVLNRLYVNAPVYLDRKHKVAVDCLEAA